VQKAKDYCFLEDDIGLLGEETHCRLDVLLVGEVDFLCEEEALLHGDGEVSDAFDPLLAVLADRPLRQPDAVDEPEAVVDDVVEHQVEEDEQLHPHQLVVLGPHHE
jgi:hypothetical protein